MFRFYRGSLPPLVGSGIYRSSQFAVYEAMYTKLDTDQGRRPIPFSGGLENRVVISGLMASLVRSVIETPIEYMKTRRQVKEPIIPRDLYRGFTMNTVSTTHELLRF